MAITYKTKNGGTQQVKSIILNGTEVKKFKYDSGDGQKRIVWCKPYSLTVQKGNGVESVKVYRTVSLEPTANDGELFSGDAIYDGDVLTVLAKPQTGYILDDYKTVCVISGDLNVNISAHVSKNELSITQDTGVATVTVKRTSSPYQNAETSILKTGADIYYGDTLTVTATPSEGYSLNDYARSYTVYGNVAVSISASVLKYKLNIPAITGVSSVTVERTSSPKQGASTGRLGYDADIYYGDTLKVTATAAPGYELPKSTVSYTVTGPITINITANKTLPMNAPQISGSMTYNIYSGAYNIDLYIKNPNNITVTADIEVEDCHSSVKQTGTITLSPNQNKTYIVGEMYTTEVDVTVTFRCAGYTTTRNSITLSGRNNTSSGGSSGSGSTSSGQS